MKRKLSPQSGFTLLEIMLVVAIIILLLGSAIYMMKPQLGIAKAAKAQADIKSISTALLSYEAVNGVLPSTEQGLAALVNKPTGEPRPRNWQRVMEGLVIDPWGMNYFYESPGKHHPDSYDLYSAGPDRKPGTDDDIGNWDSDSK
jgi:general secretion pathway protein G